MSTRFIIIGVLLALGGVFALFNPFAASLAVTSLVGVFFLLGGAFQLWAAVISPLAQGHRFGTGLMGLLALVAGIFLLARPMEGALSLTLVVGLVFLVTGIVRLALAWRMRARPPFWMLLLSGAITTLLGILIVTTDAQSAPSLLGLLLGINLIADGGGLVALGLLGRHFWK